MHGMLGYRPPRHLRQLCVRPLIHTEWETQMMTTAQSYHADLAAINAMPVRWFRVNGDLFCSLAVLQMENCDDAELCKWAESAAIGDVYRTGGASGECTVERTA